MEESDSEQSAWSLATNPWRRYGARILDAYLFGELVLVIVGAFIGLFGPDWLFYWVADETVWKRLLVWTPLMWIVAAPGIAACIAWKGTTPGKLLFSVRVVGDGKIRYATALKREAWLLLWGVGLGMPLVSLIMLVRSYSDVETDGVAKWDEVSGLRAEAAIIEGWRLLALIVGTVLVVSALLTGLILRLAMPR